jgi:glucose-1-phosphate adenylyltransferase
MSRKKILALILAGGKGSRLEVLTAERAKPVMPFGGTLRLIDFALSNCMHSRLSDVWVIEQHQLHSLNEHLSNGRPWDLDRTFGGLQVLPPYTAETPDEGEGHEGGFAAGNADAIYRHRRLIRDFQPDILIVLSADHVYKLDYNDVIRAHIDRAAQLTIVTKDIPIEEAHRFGTVIVGADNRITEFEYKPEKPRSGKVTTEVFIYDANVLLSTLDELSAPADDTASDDESGTTALKDFGHELLPHLVAAGHAYNYPLESYWRDLGTIESYWRRHQDLLADKPELDLADRSWTIHTFNQQQLPARIHETARISNSLISPGCDIRGQVERSVLSPGVIVEENAVVRDSVILTDCVVERDARIAFAIVDAEVKIGVGRTSRRAAFV